MFLGSLFWLDILRKGVRGRRKFFKKKTILTKLFIYAWSQIISDGKEINFFHELPAGYLNQKIKSLVCKVWSRKYEIWMLVHTNKCSVTAAVLLAIIWCITWTSYCASNRFLLISSNYRTWSSFSSTLLGTYLFMTLFVACFQAAKATCKVLRSRM